MSKPNEHNKVTAESMIRRAKDHRSYARSHRLVAKDKQTKLSDKVLHRAIAITHSESADILSKEAKAIRAQRGGGPKRKK